jgi:peptidylprolyl isomerase
MITPIRTVIAAAILGIGAAVIVSMRTPPAPPEEPVVAAADATGGADAGPAAPTSEPSATLAPGEQHKTASGLAYIEVKEGTGAAAKAGDNVSVHYIGRLFDGGKKFDSSYDRGQPIDFKVGAGQLIKGFDEGVLGLKVGGKRELIIPPDLGYGAQGAGDTIPPNATLIFDIELVNDTGPGAASN